MKNQKEIAYGILAEEINCQINKDNFCQSVIKFYIRNLELISSIQGVRQIHQPNAKLGYMYYIADLNLSINREPNGDILFTKSHWDNIPLLNEYKQCIDYLLSKETEQKMHIKIYQNHICYGSDEQCIEINDGIYNTIQYFFNPAKHILDTIKTSQ